MEDISVLEDQRLFELPAHLVQVEEVEAVSEGRNQRQHQIPVEVSLLLADSEGVEDQEHSDEANHADRQIDKLDRFLC